ncbi:hypothetical protein Taro_036596 [Colocasia esculenta]|uniref:Protein kinase domain-containing protein n=1 Tax=Colocasia esculenta TaxID=4460 RepID=A0A843W777_COLES|nr:hypothetical protein [Colocasia esculenta]
MAGAAVCCTGTTALPTCWRTHWSPAPPSGKTAPHTTSPSKRRPHPPVLPSSTPARVISCGQCMPCPPTMAMEAMEDIKRFYKVTRNWMGDPCAPENFRWDGVNCSYEASSPPRVIHLNLSSSGLSGGIPASLANLTALTILDMSNNSLIGAIPDFLAELPSLKLLILTGNKLTGTIPSRLCEKNQTAALSINIEGNPADRCSQTTKKKKTFILVAIIASASIGLLILLVISIIAWRIRRRRKFSTTVSDGLPRMQQKEELELNTAKATHSIFTFTEIKEITNNFEKPIGRGGFGTVYLGYVNDGTDQVAVKVLSPLSSQGHKEFHAEALLLTRVHHKNLVSLLGYCHEHNLALVYEYMDQGTLQDHLSGNTGNLYVLGWEQRVKIALQAAQGLSFAEQRENSSLSLNFSIESFTDLIFDELKTTGLDYLHNGCRPPIIHRDVKSSNILLNHDFIAKLADFGLSRAFHGDTQAPMSTIVAGTPGYLDPEYYQTYRLNEKSDVYSFGIVLLEIVTGRPVFSRWPERTHITQWVQSRLESGGINIVVDTRLCGDYDINSAHKMLEIAMACTSASSIRRMTMSSVMIKLKECLEIDVTGESITDDSGVPSGSSLP